MQPLLKRAMSAIRGWLGWNDPSADDVELPMTPPHGWLLPVPDALLALRTHAQEPCLGVPGRVAKPRA